MRKNCYLAALSLTVITICISCTQNNNSNIKKPKVSDVASLNSVDVVDSVFFVKLETSSKCLIGTISEMKLFSDYILIMDSEKSNAIFLFDKQGKFLNKIGNKGKGPEEYQALGTCYVDQKKQLICVYDPLRSCILKYKFNGDFAGKGFDFTKKSFKPDDIRCFDDGTLIVYSSNFATSDNFAIHVLDNNEKVINKFSYDRIKFKDILYKPFNSSSLFNKSENSICFIPYLSDTIYTHSLSKKNITPRLILGLGNPAVSEKDLKTINRNGDPYLINKEILGKGKNIGVKTIFENKNHIYYTYLNSNYVIKNAIYFKATDNIIHFDYYKNDLLIEPTGEDIIANDNDYFVSVIDMKRLDAMQGNLAVSKKHANDPEFADFPKFNIDLYNVIKNSTIEDNPLLVFTKFKNSY